MKKIANPIIEYMLKEYELIEIEKRCNEAQQGPWKAYVEGVDHSGGSSFIMTGEGTERRT